MRPDNATAAAVAAPGRRRRRAPQLGLVVDLEPAAQKRAIAIVGCVARCLAAALCWKRCRSTTSASGALFTARHSPCPTEPHYSGVVHSPRSSLSGCVWPTCVPQRSQPQTERGDGSARSAYSCGLGLQDTRTPEPPCRTPLLTPCCSPSPRTQVHPAASRARFRGHETHVRRRSGCPQRAQASGAWYGTLTRGRGQRTRLSHRATAPCDCSISGSRQGAQP